MAFFELNSDIKIGSFRFSGVHEVTIKRSIHGLSESATITIPSKASILKSDRSIKEKEVIGDQFNEGDPVVIRLGYNGELRTEFKGFVKKRNFDRPLVVECEGYSYKLKAGVLDTFAANVAVGDMLKLAIESIPGKPEITVVSDTSLKFESLDIARMNVASLVASLVAATDDNLTCFFLKPDVLWCGMLYTSIAKGKDPFALDVVKYKLGYNTISNAELKVREGQERLKVSYSKKVAGEKKTYVSDAFKDITKEYDELLNMPAASALKALANEKSYHTGYVGYEGHITTFLQPYVAPGSIADVSSDSYKKQNGKYLVTATEVKFGVQGARRIVELGPKLGFKNSEK